MGRDDSQDADQAYQSLVEGGYDPEVASIVRDQLRVKELERYAAEIEQLLEAKASLVDAKASELFAVLSQWTGLRHTFPTEVRLEHNGIRDSVDLAVTVARSERGNQVKFVWKSHNLHVVETIPEGFALGSLNMGRRSEHTVETQIPVLAMVIRPAATEGRGLFGGSGSRHDETGPDQLAISFRVNRSWIEEKTMASDGALDSSFASPLAFLDFISDHADNPLYTRMMPLIAGIDEILSHYLDRKKRFIEGLDL